MSGRRCYEAYTCAGLCKQFTCQEAKALPKKPTEPFSIPFPLTEISKKPTPTHYTEPLLINFHPGSHWRREWVGVGLIPGLLGVGHGQSWVSEPAVPRVENCPPCPLILCCFDDRVDLMCCRYSRPSSSKDRVLCPRSRPVSSALFGAVPSWNHGPR
jgi:hypothetical protein